MGFVPSGDPPPLGQTILEKCLTETWKKRALQIFPAETVAIVTGTWSMHKHRRDVIWFIDNEAAAAAAIRGLSSEPEVQVAHLLWLGLNCRIWIEWTNFKSNPAEGLSKRVLLDE